MHVALGLCLCAALMRGLGLPVQLSNRDNICVLILWINTASQVFRSLKKSVFTSNHVDLELQTALLQLPGALTPHVRGSRVMGPHGLPVAQPSTTSACAA